MEFVWIVPISVLILSVILGPLVLADVVFAEQISSTAENSAPIIDEIEQQVIAEGNSLAIPISASDADNNEISLSSDDLPLFAGLTDNHDGTGMLDLSPEYGDLGDYTITITATDDAETSSSLQVKVTVLESTPSSVIAYLQNQKSSLSSEDFTNLGQKVLDAAQLHKYLVGATKQERSDFQDSFLDYSNAAKKLVPIGQGVEQKMILQDISKAKLKLDNALEKLNIQEENENKAKDAKLLREKRQELADTINQLVSVESFINRGVEKDKQIVELTAKKLVLMKEVIIEEARQSNVDLTEDDIRKIEEKIDQSSQLAPAGQDSDGNKASNGKGNGGNDNNSSKGNSSDKGNNSSKGNSSDKGNNGNKGENDKSKK